MASVYKHSSRNGYCVQIVLFGGTRVVLWLGPIAKSGASYAARQIEQLAASAGANVHPSPEAMRWAMGTNARIKKRLIEWGLIPACNLGTFTIHKWFDHYCDSRTDMKDVTKSKLKNARRHLLAAVPDKDLRSVTVADADRFDRSLKGAESHKGKLIKMVKQVFRAAVDDRLLESNPFDRLRASTEIDHNRSRYIDQTTVTAVVDKAPGQECRLAILLARYAGLRIPSELLSLKITDIDWEQNRISIESPKGEKYAHRRRRLIPLFPEVRDELLSACESAPPGSIYLINRYRNGTARTIRKQAIAAIEAAKVTQWPKLFVNLRASCRTDLEKRFPVHVCDDWLGHSDKVAQKHYKRVTPEDFTRAVAGAVTNAQPPQPTAGKNSKKAREKR